MLLVTDICTLKEFTVNKPTKLKNILGMVIVGTSYRKVCLSSTRVVGALKYDSGMAVDIVLRTLEHVHLYLGPPCLLPSQDCILAYWGHVFQVLGMVDTTLWFFSLFCFVHLFCDHF